MRNAKKERTEAMLNVLRRGPLLVATAHPVARVGRAVAGGSGRAWLVAFVDIVYYIKKDNGGRRSHENASDPSALIILLIRI